MEVLVLSTNTLPSSPSGPAYIAGTALAAGHRVQIFETLFYSDPIGALEKQLADSNPDIVAVSIRLVHGYILDENAEYGTRHLDLRVRVKQVVDCVRRISDARIVLGGPGFNYYGPDWLAYLDLDYGIRGEADNGFPRYLKCVEEGGDIHAIPGSVFRRNGGYVNVPRERVENLDATAFPAYELCDLENYAELGISPAILTKRGCAFRCTYCPIVNWKENATGLKHPPGLWMNLNMSIASTALS